jgi:hypothetical protein
MEDNVSNNSGKKNRERLKWKRSYYLVRWRIMCETIAGKKQGGTEVEKVAKKR